MTSADPIERREAVSTLQQGLEGDPGFAGLELDDDGVVTVFWKGEPGPAADALVHTASTTVAVRLRPAAHTAAELLVEMDRLWHRTGPGYTVASMSPRPDGSGLDVEVVLHDPASVVELPTSVPYTVEVVDALPRALPHRPGSAGAQMDDDGLGRVEPRGG